MRGHQVPSEEIENGSLSGEEGEIIDSMEDLDGSTSVCSSSSGGASEKSPKKLTDELPPWNS